MRLQKNKVMMENLLGTAGSPMLAILQKKNLTNILVVVTRYFGGILLGTGGLVKAYSDATKEAIEDAKEVEKEDGYVIEVILGYEEQKNFEYLCEKNKITIISKEFAEKIKNMLEISEKRYQETFQANEANQWEIRIKEKKYIAKT